MHIDLKIRRRVLLVTYQRCLRTDRAWIVALREMKAWFPVTNQPYRSTIGSPGSPMRRLYERRERAILQLETARRKLEEAKRRLAARRQKPQAPRALLVTHFQQ